MKPELEKLCADFTANREEIRKAFGRKAGAMQPVCANIFCASGQAADAGRLKECFRVVKKRTKPFSRFRNGKVRSVLSGMLSLGENPEDRMTLADEYYRLLRRYFKGTEYLVLAAFLLTDLADQRLTEEKAARGKEIFRRMNRQHRMLTNKMDSVFAMLLAFSEKTDNQLLTDIEACYRALKARFSSSGDAQTAAQILSVTDGAPEEKAQRVIALYDALLEADVKYGRARGLSPLAALSLADTPVPVLVEEIKEVYEFLGTQKGYGKKEEELNEQALHAAMIVSDQYAGTDNVNATVTAVTLEMLISKEQASRVSLAIQALQFAAKLLSASDNSKPSETSDNTPSEAADAAPSEATDEAQAGSDGTKPADPDKGAKTQP